jgi:PAS domain S-box-containing protein
MGTGKFLKNMRAGLSPPAVILASTLATLALSILCLSNGCFIIFQNLFYIPIVFACIHYGRSGFAFSVFVSGVYFCLVLVSTHEPTIYLQALVRSLIFVLIAGIITYLSCVRKRAEDTLRTQRELLLEMTARFPGVVYQFYARPNGERGLYYVSSGSERIFGLPPDPEEFFGRFTRLVIPEHRKSFLRSIEDAVREVSDWEYEGMLQMPSGEKRWFSGNSIPSQHSKEVVFNGILTDITERKVAAAEKSRVEVLASNAETKSRFTSMVSHELRSPLAVVKEALDIVLEGIPGSVNQEQKDILGMAKTNVDRLGRLINNVLDFQKIEFGKMEFNIREDDLNGVAMEVHKSMRVLSRRKGLDLRLDVEEGLSRVRFDRDRLIQVLTNLMSNAISSTERGSVTLMAMKENGVVHIMVRDTGTGIPAEDIQKIFQPFEQVAGTQAKKKGGTGLGLAIAKEIVLAHQGKIWVESAVDKGSAFHFTLPL